MRRLALAAVLLPCLAAADIRYSLAPLPSDGAVAVTIRPDKMDRVAVFRIPAWCPGFYFLQKYQDDIYDVAASDPEGKALPVSKVDEHGWQVDNAASKPIIFSYKVRATDPGLGFFGLSVMSDKAFVNGASTFMYLDGHKQEPTELSVKLPPGWDIATGSPSRADGIYLASGYDELLDHPIQMGKMEKRSFKIGEYSFDVVFVAANNDIRPKIDEQVAVLKSVSEPAIALFHGAPFNHYVYILHLTNAGFLGGLEHRGSTTIALPNSPNLDMTTIAAHEFFHTWNVKNIRPKVLGPFDYTKEVRTGNLWFAEGVTDYYANLNAYRSGLRDAKWLYQTLGNEIGTLQRSKTRKEVTLEDACKQTWESGGFGFKDLDYYNKGCVAGFVFDMAIRGASNKSLDDLMRDMYGKYRLPQAGYDEDDIRKELNSISGKDLTELYNTVIRSTNEVPYKDASAIGLRVMSPDNNYPTAGYTTIAGVIDSVNELATRAGFKVGDVVLDMHGEEVMIRRGESVMNIPAVWTTASPSRYRLEEDPRANAKQREKLRQWLKRPI
jgi:predicted metalloprotease with PDZ domain